jgi:hypothetical protein
MHALYSDKLASIENLSNIFSFILPSLIIVTFYKKLTKFVAGLNLLVLVLSLFYGFYFVGADPMLSSFLYVTIATAISIIILCVVIYKPDREKIAEM